MGDRITARGGGSLSLFQRTLPQAQPQQIEGYVCGFAASLLDARVSQTSFKQE